MKRYSFENLEVWKKSRTLVKVIYSASREFPDDERYGLTSQIRRAAVSISSNIAEGSSRKSNKDQARFYVIAFSSLMEVLSQLILSVDLDFMKEEILFESRVLIDEIGRMLNALTESRK